MVHLDPELAAPSHRTSPRRTHLPPLERLPLGARVVQLLARLILTAVLARRHKGYIHLALHVVQHDGTATRARGWPQIRGRARVRQIRWPPPPRDGHDTLTRVWREYGDPVTTWPPILNHRMGLGGTGLLLAKLASPRLKPL